MLSPIEHAKQLLMDNPFTCVISNGETAYTSIQRGIAPLMGWYEDGQDLHHHHQIERQNARKAPTEKLEEILECGGRVLYFKKIFTLAVP